MFPGEVQRFVGKLNPSLKRPQEKKTWKQLLVVAEVFDREVGVT